MRKCLWRHHSLSVSVGALGEDPKIEKKQAGPFAKLMLPSGLVFFCQTGAILSLPEKTLTTLKFKINLHLYQVLILFGDSAKNSLLFSRSSLQSCHFLSDDFCSQTHVAKNPQSILIIFHSPFAGKSNLRKKKMDLSSKNGRSHWGLGWKKKIGFFL